MKLGVINIFQKAWFRVGILIIIIIVGILANIYPLVLAESSGQTETTVIKKKFDNGLTLLIKPNSANEVVAVAAFLRMGAIYEPLDQRGISKLMQRILVKGTTTRSVRDVIFDTESVGASITANIDDYGYGSVTLTTTLFGLDTGLKVFLDLLLHPAFTAREVEKEKQLMIEQLTTSKDQPTSLVYQNFLALYYGSHPIGIQPEAIAAKVKKITRADLLAWYQKIYIPNNMVISMVGKIDPDVIIKMFQESLGQLPSGDQPAMITPELSNPNENRQFIKVRESQALFMVLGYPAPSISDPDYPVMEVLNYILGGDMGSRLFIELRDKKGLAYDVSTSYYAANYPANILAFMATKPSNYQAAKHGITAEFEESATKLVPPNELAAAKQALKGSFLMKHETNAAQNKLLGSYELLGLGYQQDQRYPDLITKVTAEDIRRVAQKYFTYYTLSIVSPIEIKAK